MKRLIGCGLLLLAACEVREESGAPVPMVASDDPNAIECALDGSSAFVRACIVERVPEGDAVFLVARHPDGGFRRFEIVRDGRGLAVADGAGDASLAVQGNLLEVAVDDDRYRFPATIGEVEGVQ